jgi:hypothetical protein
MAEDLNYLLNNHDRRLRNLETRQVKGIAGAQGTTGVQGYVGSVGVQGTVGPQGIQGRQGIQGVQGFGYAQMQGIQGITGSTGAGGALGYWGSFWSTQNQTAANTTTAYVVTLNNTDPDSNGVSVVSNSRVTHAFAGVYNLQFSIQFLNTANQDANTNVWFRKNGTDITDSASQVTVTAQHAGGSGQIILALNYMLTLAANDYIELVWQTENTNVSLEYLAAGTTPTTPRTPSVIFTSQQVMYTQLGAQGVQGTQGLQGLQGRQGLQGIQGIQGIQGVGVPAGGTTGQVLAKNSSTNYDTAWQTRIQTYIQSSAPVVSLGDKYLWWDTSEETLTLWIEDGT